jgi:hypothetical protein
MFALNSSASEPICSARTNPSDPCGYCDAYSAEGLTLHVVAVGTAYSVTVLSTDDDLPVSMTLTVLPALGLEGGVIVSVSEAEAAPVSPMLRMNEMRSSLLTSGALWVYGVVGMAKATGFWTDL